MNMEKMQEVFSNEAFVRSLLELETAAEVQTALKEKGVELSEQEILSIRDLLVKVQSGEITAEQLDKIQNTSESGELSDEDLENIAGGFLGITFTAAMVVKLAIIAGKTALFTAGGVALGFGTADAVERRW